MDRAPSPERRRRPPVPTNFTAGLWNLGAHPLHADAPHGIYMRGACRWRTFLIHGSRKRVAAKTKSPLPTKVPR